MLYAILVEGQGPLGSVFNADEFSDREVRDTDGDGLPEFVDAWGEPLQFYRWPILYHSDLQKGYSRHRHRHPGPYKGPFEAREQDPLDPNQQLVAPAWWSSTRTPARPWSSRRPPVSGGVMTFQKYFHTLVEPLSGRDPSPTQSYWDRGTTSPSAGRTSRSS